VSALAADELSLDHRQRQPAVLKAHGNGLSSDATTETNDVEFLRHDPALRHRASHRPTEDAPPAL